MPQGNTRTFLTGASAEKILTLPLFEEYTSHFIWGKGQGSYRPQVEPVCCGCPASGVSLPLAIPWQFVTSKYQFPFLQSKDVDRGGQSGTSWGLMLPVQALRLKSPSLQDKMHNEILF